MPTVGGVSVDLLKGNSEPEKQSSKVWRVAGVAGVGIMLEGSNQSQFAYRAIVFEASGAESTLQALQALQGTVVNIVDEFGKSRTNAFIQRVGTPTRKLVFHEGAYVTRGEVLISGVFTA